MLGWRCSGFFFGGLVCIRLVHRFVRVSLSLDRLSSNQLTITHKLIARMYGVRRESITDTAGKPQRSGMIHYSRGHIAMLDRARLEAQVCECYGVVKREFQRLFPVKIPLANRSRSAFFDLAAQRLIKAPCVPI